MRGNHTAWREELDVEVGRTDIATAPVAARGPDSPVRRSAWRWRSWTRWPFSGAAVAVAAVAVVVDVSTAWADVSLGSLGRVPLSPALPIGVLLVVMIGARRLGFDRANLRAWRELLVVGGFLLVYAIVMYGAKAGQWQEGVGLAVAALGEELIYRLAVIVVVGALCARILGRDWRNASEWGVIPGVAALVVGSVVFSILPGHVAQMDDAFHALPFASLGLVLGYTVLRTGAIIPAAIVHALMNLSTIAALNGASPEGWRDAFVAIALLSLMASTIVAGLRLGILRREPVVIDLRAGEPEGTTTIA